MVNQENKRKSGKASKKMNKKQNKEYKKIREKGAEKKSAPNRSMKKISSDDEIIIGIPKNESSNSLIKKDKKKRKLKKKKVKNLCQNQIKRRKIILKLIKWTCVLGCFLGAGIYIIMSPLFAVKAITISTDGKLAEQEIISWAGINLNENIFKFTKKQIIANIKENAYVDEVIIKRKLPDNVQISIKERIPILMITYGNSYVYINSQGYMLEISSEYKNFPILMGIDTKEDSIQTGKRLCNEDLHKLTSVLKIMELCENADISELITSIDISDQNDYKVNMDKEEKTMHLGDCSMLEERLIWAKTILNKEKGIPGEIFVNMNLNIESPYFRERV